MAEPLTLDDLLDLNQEELQELVLAKQEEYADLKSNSTKGAQQLLDEKKLLEKAIKLSVNDESLAKLRETDPELAEKISQHLLADVDLTGNAVKGNVTVQDVWELVEQEIAKRDVQKKIDKVVDQLPDDIKDTFKKEYEELIEWKKITADNADKFIKLALNSINESSTSDVDYAKSISLWGSTVSSKSKSSKQTSDEARIAYARKLTS